MCIATCIIVQNGDTVNMADCNFLLAPSMHEWGDFYALLPCYFPIQSNWIENVITECLPFSSEEVKITSPEVRSLTEDVSELVAVGMQ